MLPDKNLPSIPYTEAMPKVFAKYSIITKYNLIYCADRIALSYANRYKFKNTSACCLLYNPPTSKLINQVPTLTKQLKED